MTVVLVDVDGTLLDGPTSETLFVMHLVRGGRLGLRQFAAAALFLPRWTPRFGRHVFKKNKAYLSGLNVADVADLAADFVRDALAQHVRPRMVERLSEHRANGDRIALLTGTPDFIAKPLAALVGADDWCATRLAQNDQAFTAAPPEFHPFADDKLVAAQALCDRAGSRIEECAAYGNSIYDLALLRRVRHPVAVWPDRALGQTARDAGWEILDGRPRRGDQPAAQLPARSRHSTG